MIHYTVASLHYIHCYASNEWSDPDKSMHEWGAQRMKGALLDLHRRRWRLQRAASTVQCEQVSPWESRNKAWAALQQVSRTQRGITFSQGMQGAGCSLLEGSISARSSTSCLQPSPLQRVPSDLKSPPPTPGCYNVEGLATSLWYHREEVGSLRGGAYGDEFGMCL
jgi:hypothetical protein